LRRIPVLVAALVLGAIGLHGSLALASSTDTAARISTTGGPVAPVGVPGNWRLTFSDEFAGDSLSAWETCYPDQPKGCTNSGTRNWSSTCPATSRSRAAHCT
jgi:hypothetical protein